MDRGYILAGASNSFNTGNDDLLLIKTDADGAVYDCDLCVEASPEKWNIIPDTDYLDHVSAAPQDMTTGTAFPDSRNV